MWAHESCYQGKLIPWLLMAWLVVLRIPQQLGYQKCGTVKSLTFFLKYIPRIMDVTRALLCFVVVLYWYVNPCTLGVASRNITIVLSLDIWSL